MSKLFSSKIYQVVGGITFALSNFGTLPGFAATQNDINAIFIFGNSLADTGNYYNFSNSTFPPSPFYTQGRFSNGSVWSDYLAQQLDLNPVNVTALSSGSSIPTDGINFSFGGSTTGSQNLGGPPFWGLEQQLTAYTNLLSGQSANPQALYILSSGGNDYIAGGATNPQEPVNNLVNALELLIDSGASQIMIFNLPNLGDVPLARNQDPAVVEALNQLSANHNALLGQRLKQLRQTNPDTELIVFDLNSLVTKLLNNPTAFGFSNVTDNCTGIDFPVIDPINDFPTYEACRSLLENDPRAFLFWDNQHPTTEGHRVIANEALKTLSVPESDACSALGLLGLGWLFYRVLSDNLNKK